MMVRHYSLKGFYETERTVGCGGFAKVKLATHVATGEKVAIKIMDKALLGADLARVETELGALKTVCHEHVCKLYQVIETDTHFFIIMEYCSGGELFDHIVEKNRLTESESRMFFRQIVSAVAYLHSLGYAHRDLKPENILLDKYQNLKLIDFGLCAKPEGGINNLLQTSCGSPTYAAPELVLGKQYLGTEVDIWAMGVLLYTLLVGALPFDDNTIDCLYRKILAGRYEEPHFLSLESKRLIRSMLQVDPKNRITIKELLNHPWLTLGILDPVEIKSENVIYQDHECLEVMACYNQVKKEAMWDYLKQRKYDYHTATYLLLLSRKKRGSSLKLNSSATKVDIPNKGTIIRRKPVLRNLNIIQSRSDDVVGDNQMVETPTTPSETTNLQMFFNDRTPDNKPVKKSGFIEPDKPSSVRKPHKRYRSPGPDDSSPVPAKRVTTDQSTPVHTPDRKYSANNSETPGSARRVLGSIERSFHRVVNVLTPRKNEDSVNVRPSLLTNKELCNVSTTQYHDPEFVISELSRALEKKGICCKRKGFTLRGKVEPNVLKNLGDCSFELEICYLPHMGPPPPKFTGTPTRSILKKGSLNYNSPARVNVIRDGEAKPDNFKDSSNALVGIRRKRLKGDAWCYKKVCEEILALTASDMKGVTESSV
ncbi:unnamed protein product [Phaedon cochleariae]|uniref:non-specific serine/threonine protein kinase n=1 Tax=Phaedon cochleariae TaxID=80249 RepID=A0A9N9X597_PHACE|nr:unnamed protein product [Phaedon cochleariae]